jgi:ferredoxin-like protein FixX
MGTQILYTSVYKGCMSVHLIALLREVQSFQEHYICPATSNNKQKFARKQIVQVCIVTLYEANHVQSLQISNL